MVNSEGISSLQKTRDPDLLDDVYHLHCRHNPRCLRMESDARYREKASHPHHEQQGIPCIRGAPRYFHFLDLSIITRLCS
jgi:hypothetical protein